MNKLNMKNTYDLFVLIGAYTTQIHNIIILGRQRQRVEVLNEFDKDWSQARLKYRNIVKRMFADI